MRKKFMRNKFFIVFVIVVLIMGCNFYNIAFGTTYEPLDFKYGKVNVACLNVRCRAKC